VTNFQEHRIRVLGLPGCDFILFSKNKQMGILSELEWSYLFIQWSPVWAFCVLYKLFV
jgi:hypothetical protein